MDFYNLQDSDHQLLEKMMNITPTTAEFRDYLERRFFNLQRVLGKKAVLLIEEDPRIQNAMQRVINEVNPGAHIYCLFALEELEEELGERNYDLVIANYYLSEDEIDYEFWEGLREVHPHIEMMIFSHVNDRDYYEMLDKLGKNLNKAQRDTPLKQRLKSFFEDVFGG